MSFMSHLAVFIDPALSQAQSMLTSPFIHSSFTQQTLMGLFTMFQAALDVARVIPL